MKIRKQDASLGYWGIAGACGSMLLCGLAAKHMGPLVLNPTRFGLALLGWMVLSFILGGLFAGDAKDEDPRLARNLLLILILVFAVSFTTLYTAAKHENGQGTSPRPFPFFSAALLPLCPPL